MRPTSEACRTTSTVASSSCTQWPPRSSVERHSSVAEERAAHGVLGGLVIGGIYNGMYLLGLAVQWEYIVTGLVLVGAVTIDAVSRRGASRSTSRNG